MGWAQRAQVERDAYRVRRWTAFPWGETTKHENEHLDGVAAKIAARLDSGIVMRVSVDGASQLMFELEVRAENAVMAAQIAVYRIDRALRVKVAPRGRGVRTLTPPWGAIEVEAM